jgi:dipeptidyl aminopeptidase/acylaminoacyl peptidase
MMHGSRSRLHQGGVAGYRQERLAEEVRTAELVLYPDGNHGVTNRAYESRSRMADWLAARLSF